MPNELSLKPLAPNSLVTKLDSNLKNISLDMFHAPFTQADSLPTVFHRADMSVHRLYDCWISDRGMILHQGQGFGFLGCSRWGHRWQCRPHIVEHAE